MSRYIDVSNLDIPSDENDYDELVAFADKVAKMITDAPSIDIEPKRGEWGLFYESKDGDNVYKCNCCRFITVIPEGIKLFSFCPNCGADMRKREGER